MSFRLVPLFADSGVPMLFVTWPMMIVALVPIIAVEGLLLRKRTGHKTWPVFKATAVANLASTILGIPLAWLALLFCEVGVFAAASRIPALQNSGWHSPMAQVATTILGAAWINPTEKTFLWAVPLAALVLLVPFYFVSVWSERLVMSRMLPVAKSDEPQAGEIGRPTLRRAVRDANLLSYAGLAVLTCALLVRGLLHK